MIKKSNVLRAGLVSTGVFLALIVVLSANVNKAHAAVVLDPTTTTMLVNVISATGNLLTTIQAHINAGDFTPAQSAAISATLGSIRSILANISAMIGGVGLPNTGFPPHSATAN